MIYRLLELVLWLIAGMAFGYLILGPILRYFL